MREHKKGNAHLASTVKLGDADREFAASNGSGEARETMARFTAYASLNSRLAGHLAGLRKRDGELEVKYRRVIALCTGVPEESVDGVLGQLVQAVESEGDVGASGQDVGRVREFLRRVEMVI
jgi:hypothetical protein